MSHSSSEFRFRMPEEWARHAATWLSWPRNGDTWPNNLAAAQQEFVELVRAIAAFEPVKVMAGKDFDFDQATRALANISNVDVVPIQTNDAWARDYAPTFVVDREHGQLAAVDWFYNAWGGKYPPFDDDQKVTEKVAQHLGCQHTRVDLCLEGGAVEVDELGTLFCTKTCAFDEHRNPGLSPAEIEQRIMEAIGATQAVWLHGDALVGDDTDGHIDQLARCAPGGVILFAWTDDQTNEQYGGLAQNRNDLTSGLANLALEKTLVPLPIPDPVMMFDVQIPACYCNFYITNGGVIVPTFGAKQDDEAARIIGEHFPNHELVQCPSANLTVGLGSFHCLTQQQPAI
ncbi:MAG: agmatine deiminase family protein [Pirellulaceae bacterium]